VKGENVYSKEVKENFTWEIVGKKLINGEEFFEFKLTWGNNNPQYIAELVSYSLEK
jgi:hypothetical protein